MTNLEIKKDILNKVKYSEEYTIHIGAWYSYELGEHSIWGDICLETFEEGFIEFYSIDTIDFNKDESELTKEEIKHIEKELKKKYTYFSKHFDNVKLETKIQCV